MAWKAELKEPRRIRKGYIIPLSGRDGRGSKEARDMQTGGFRKKGSLTIETALVLPLFLFGVFLLLSLLTSLQFTIAMESALRTEAKRLSEQVYEPEGQALLNEACVRRDITEALSESFTRLPVRGGAEGIDYSGSLLNNREIIILRAEYEWQLPFDLMGMFAQRAVNSCTQHTWIGYETGLYGLNKDGEEEVYVARNGRVYHRNINCSHIKLKIYPTTGGEVDSLRNNNGGKYYPCEHCHAKKSDPRLYVAENGDRYHNSLSCSGLKRTIEVIPLSEALSRGLGACKRCGGTK